MPLLKREPEIYPADLLGPAPDVEAHGGEAGGTALRALRWPVAPPPDADTISRKPWWIAYTRSRQEKAFARHLLQCQVPYYLPQREHRIRAGDRWRTSHLPLFTGYVFFRADARDRLTALKSNVVARLVDVPDGRGLEAELRSLWLLQTTGAPLVPHPYLAPGDPVEIVAGSLRGYRGSVLREKGLYRLVVSITLLRQSVAVELDREILAPARLRKVG